MCEGNATTTTTTATTTTSEPTAAEVSPVVSFAVVVDGENATTTTGTTFHVSHHDHHHQPVPHHSQNNHPSRRIMKTSSTNNKVRADDHLHPTIAWDMIPPFMTLPPPNFTKNNHHHHHHYTDFVWQETLLQSHRTLQHMGTCIVVPNDVLLLSSSSTTTTSTSDTHPFKSPPPTTSTTSTMAIASFSTHPIFTTISTTSTTSTVHFGDTNSNSTGTDFHVSYMIVGCHDGTICAWNLHHLPALQNYMNTTGCRSSTEPIRHYQDHQSNNNVEQDTPLLYSATSTMDPIHVLDTSSPIQPCCILDTTQHTPSTTVTKSLNPNPSNNNHLPNTSTTGSTIIPQSSLSTIVHIFPISNDTLIVMNMMGMIYMVQIMTLASRTGRGGMDHPGTTTRTRTVGIDSNTTITNNNNNNTESMRMIVRQKWSTGRIHPTSGCGSYHLDDSMMYIGYQSGHVECWSIPTTSSLLSVSSNPTDDTDMASVSLEPPPTLRWCGNFTNDHSSPPPSIASIVPLNKPQQTNVHECLVISLHSDGRERPNTSDMVEVIDVTAIMMAWNNEQLTNQDSASRSLPLEDFIVLPEAGREILNVFPTNEDRSNPRPLNHWIQSRGTNCLLSTSIGTTTSSNGTDDTTVIALGHADGMVTMLDVTPNMGEQPTTTPAWGVSTNHNRYCSSYPCIGIGRIDLSDCNHENNNDTIIAPQPYLACCLRGAATYLIPLPSAGRHVDATVLALSVPHNLDEDVSVRYTQGFATGNIPMNNRNDTTEVSPCGDSLPLLAYVWPGGVIDIFSCGLLPHVSVSTDVQLLKELIANGSVDALRELILSLDDDSDMMLKWSNVLLEIRRHGETTPIKINDIISDSFISLRTELLNIKS